MRAQHQAQAERIRGGTKAIRTEGLPEPLVRALEVMVEMLREQLPGTRSRRPRVELPVRSGGVGGTLSRREIYDHLG